METVERSTGKKPLAALSLLALGAGLLLFPAQARESVSKSVLTCLSSLVPSLFPFLVLASLGVRSGAGALLGRLLAPSHPARLSPARHLRRSFTAELFGRLPRRSQRRVPAVGGKADYP